MNKATIILSTIIALGSSCNSYMSQEQLVKYITNPKHGLVQEKSIAGINMKVVYRPSDFLVQQELMTDTIIDKQKLEKLQQTYGKNIYFLLSVSRSGQEVLTGLAGDAQQFSEMVSKLSFGMGENVLLVSSENDTIPMLDYIYPRMYGMSQSTDILFAFEKKNIKADYLEFKMKEFGLQTGDVNFRFRVKDILKTPKLKFSK
jgi:hypothetical protein